MTEVVTILRVSSEDAIKNLDKFNDAMGKAAGVSAKFVTELTDSPRSIASISKSFERLQSAGDPIFAAQVKRQKEVEKAFQAAGLAVANGIATQEQAARAVKNLADRYDAQVVATQKAAFAQTTLGRAVTGVSGQLVALSAGAGPVGTFLSALGPWGLAAAVGLGAAEAAFNAALNAAHRLGDEASNLNKFAQATGLTTTQIQALTAETAKNGISAQDAVGAITKFTIAWDDLRKGQGDFLTRLRAVDAGLADQMQRTTDVAEAIDIYSAAVKKAEEQNDIAARNALLRAAGGRSGVITFGTIAGAVNQNGGVAGLTEQFESAHAVLQDKFLKDIDKLKNEIDETKKRADLLFGSIGAESVLSTEQAWQQLRLSVADTLKEIEKTDKLSLWESFFEKASAYGRLAAGWVGFGLRDLPPGPTRSNSPGNGSVENDAFFSGPSGVAPSSAPPLVPKTPQAIAADAARDVAALGSAASAYERLQSRIKSLNSDLADGKISADIYQRALGGANLDYSTAAINARVGALGLMADTSDVATQAQLRINKANQDGANISRTQAAILRDAAVIQANSIKVNTDAQFGLASSTDILNQKTAEFINIAQQRNYTDAQTAAGLEVVARNARQAYEQMEIARSATPGLTQLSFEAGDLNKQFDQFAVGSLNNMTTAITNFTSGNKSAAQSAKDLGLAVVTALQQMIIKMLIIAPIAAALKAILPFGGFGFANGGTFGGGELPGFGTSNFVGPLKPNASGNVFGFASGSAFLAGGGFANSIVNSPTLFRFANGGAPGLGVMGEAGPEAVMPLKRGPDGRLGVSGQGGGRPIQITYAPAIDARGADAAAVARLANAQAKDRQEFAKNVMKVVSGAQDRLEFR